MVVNKMLIQKEMLIRTLNDLSSSVELSNCIEESILITEPEFPPMGYITIDVLRDKTRSIKPGNVLIVTTTIFEKVLKLFPVIVSGKMIFESISENGYTIMLKLLSFIVMILNLSIINITKNDAQVLMYLYNIGKNGQEIDEMEFIDKAVNDALLSNIRINKSDIEESIKNLLSIKCIRNLNGKLSIVEQILIKYS